MIFLYSYIHCQKGETKFTLCPVEVMNHVTADQSPHNKTMMRQFAIRLNVLNDLCFSESKLYIPEFRGGSRSIY